jgi:hypothetical protein
MALLLGRLLALWRESTNATVCGGFSGPLQIAYGIGSSENWSKCNAVILGLVPRIYLG